MPIKIVHPNHYEIVGRGLVLLSSPPIPGQSTELHTGALTEEIALLSKAHAIIGKMKKLVDPSEVESFLSEFAIGVRELVADQGIRLVMEIRGKKESGLGIEIASSSPEVNQIVEIVKTAFALSFPVGITVLDSTQHQPYTNDKDVQTLVLGLGPDERGFQREAVIDITAETVGLINQKLGLSESDEGSRDVLN